MKQSRGKGKTATVPRPAGGFGGGFGGFGSSGGRSKLSYLAEPPSFVAVADPNVVVAFKNVLKKDGTTKAKGLEELVNHAQSHPFEQGGGVDEAVLDVWVQMYPRVAIDNSRRVRELSHTLQFELMRSARKRMERHIPTIVGAWLAGLYDRDRAVSRAANDGLSSFLNTPEKTLALWKKCQGKILDYAVDAIQETQDTLSDERSTTKEDAEAKFYRVVTAGLSLVLALLQKMQDGDMAKFQDRYDDFFAQDTVWKAITFADSPVRKTVCQLLFACLDRKLPCTQDPKVKQAVVTGGLRTNQAGSALEYVIVLTKLTQSNPEIWASAGEKKSPISRLEAFVAKGSQGSSARFWDSLDQLLKSIPVELLSADRSTPPSLLTSLKSGVTNRDEPRTHAPSSWKCYINTAKRLLEALGADDQLTLGKEHLFPIFDQFLFPASERATVLPSGPNATAILVQAYLVLSSTAKPQLSSAFGQEWDRLATMFSSKISESLPEVAKEYQSSQDRIGEDGRRWFGLVGHIHQKLLSEPDDSATDYTADPSDRVISQCLSLLENRNLKPFGAARIVEHALSTSPHLFEGARWQALSDFLVLAAEIDMAKIVDSPSSRHFLSWVRLLGSSTARDRDYSRLWNSLVDAALALESGDSRNLTLASLISHEKGAELAKENKTLKEAVLEQAIATAQGKTDAWDLLDAAVTYSALDEDVYHDLAQNVVKALDKDAETSPSALRALEMLVKARPQLFSADESLHTALVAKLLSLSEMADGAASPKLQAIRALLDSSSDGKLPVVGIIQSNLGRATPQSLDIETIATQAEAAADVPLEDLFPSTSVWTQELVPLFQKPIDPSLSITSSAGGAAALVKQEEDVKAAPVGQRDSKGRSVPVRMALYLNRILESRLDFAALPAQLQVELLYLHWTTVQIVSDQITTMDYDGPWKSLARPEDLSDAEELVSRARNLIINKVGFAARSSASTEEPMAEKLLDMLLHNSAQLTSKGLYSSRCLLEMIQSNVEVYGLSAGLEERLLETELLKATPATVLVAAAVLSGLGETAQASKQVNNFCNRLVSDVAGASAQTEKAHMSLVLLTACGQVYDKGALPVANNRIVFAAKQITSWLDEPETLSPAFSAEICRSLTRLLPCMKDVYGSYWEKTLEFCSSLWTRAGEYSLVEALAFIHASINLVRALEALEEPNDDLEDALKEFSEHKSKALVELLKLPREGSSSLSLSVVDGIICREVEKLPMRHMPDLGDMFPLVAAESRDIQTAAFTLLHRALPAQQAQKSVDVLLDKTDARLPDELLSLLLNAPTLESYSDEMLARFPPAIRSYLLAWTLVFDAFSTSSFKVRGDFSDNLKAEGCLPPLLDFMFDVLGHSAAHAFRLEKAGLGTEQIRNYDVKLADAETDEKSMQWLLVHLFYLVLKYVPGLFRSWYMDCRSKQTRIAVEAWTTRYFSPLTVDDTLDEVQRWVDTQEPSTGDDEQDLIVKVSRTAREVTAGYEVDESQAAIAIKIPSSYPLEGVTVTGLHRVAVTERKWQSWIMTTQGVITFSNGNIIDGLQVFKRNIVGALKGQGECAICYSIISTDKRMPDKRCTTCRNLFHRTCLYKWFQTSNQNTCPLCRNPIDYLGADTQKRRQG
ncbi:E3 ubiquitin-protein ligase listerin [Geosmithia morbida]|uniref:E3 ubiquitin-protein ligase listerin n=1 Tax=Geosmithia morbida TaxID=1094350 RepID=A0A9P4YWI2_9HYPO|nr:E3 ubiquitin-protein ligase listerin [Geosmithia morbida]KAF4123082.1 E3 ubiquitin-protein ligase listerin [Geosmithia morbida]